MMKNAVEHVFGWLDMLVRIILLFLFISSNAFAQDEESITLFDKARQRSIPIEIYQAAAKSNLPVVIINHGYSVKNTEYSFIAEPLSKSGYFVVSIQHDLAGDPPIARTGQIFKKRKALWQRGT